LLRDGQNRPLAARGATPFSRFIAAEWPPGRPITARPLKLAVAVSNPVDLADYGLTVLDEGEEWALLETAVGGLAVELIRLPPPCTLSAIEAAIQAGCHLLHFVGHGRFSQRRGQAMLYLADEANQVALTTGEAFAAMVDRQLATGGPEAALRLIFLASCQTAAQAPADSFSGLAPQAFS